MDYDRKTKALMKEIKTLDESLDRGILPKLAQLEKIADSLNDDYLTGFTCYYYSFAIYYFDPKRKNFMQYLSRAVHALMKVRDHEMLARVFNLVAIDAASYGSYDVAYNYYMNALYEALMNGSIVFLTVIETNLSLLFLELRDFRQALQHIKNAIRYMKDYQNTEMRIFTLHAAYVDEAAIYLEMKDYTAATKSLQKAMRILPRSTAPDEDLSLSLTLIRFRLAEINGETEEQKKQFDTLIGMLKREPNPEGYAEDIRNLGRFLMQRDEMTRVRKLIDTVGEGLMASHRVHVLRMLSTMKVQYAIATENKKYLRAALDEQQHVMECNRSNLNRTHNYTLDLVELNSSIRRDHLHTRTEHARLEKKAYQDALTGLPNLRRLNKDLSAAFDRSYQNRTPLGIAFLDIDNFKEYNDTFGHIEGDRCLVAVAKEVARLCESVTQKDALVSCGRYGGDEFVIIYEGLTQQQIRRMSAELNEQIRSLARVFPGNPQGGIVTVSQGICVGIPKCKERVWNYLSEADKAMYMVKKARLTSRPKRDGICLRMIK